MKLSIYYRFYFWTYLCSLCHFERRFCLALWTTFLPFHQHQCACLAWEPWRCMWIFSQCCPSKHIHLNNTLHRTSSLVIVGFRCRPPYFFLQAWKKDPMCGSSYGLRTSWYEQCYLRAAWCCLEAGLLNSSWWRLFHRAYIQSLHSLSIGTFSSPACHRLQWQLLHKEQNPQNLQKNLKPYYRVFWSQDGVSNWSFLVKKLPNESFPCRGNNLQKLDPLPPIQPREGFQPSALSLTREHCTTFLMKKWHFSSGLKVKIVVFELCTFVVFQGEFEKPKFRITWLLQTRRASLSANYYW